MDFKSLQSCSNRLQQQDGGLHSTSTILVTAIATIAVLYVAMVYQRRKKLPPGPWPWPIVGNLPLLLGSQKPKISAEIGPQVWRSHVSSTRPKAMSGSLDSCGGQGDFPQARCHFRIATADACLQHSYSRCLQKPGLRTLWTFLAPS